MIPFDPKQDSCDARQSLLDAPSGERIENHAAELLNRALGVRPPVAFVGAGASMAYGRISWRDAVIAMQKSIIAQVGEPEDPVCKRLLDLLKQVEIDRDSPSDSADYLVTFQLSEQLYRAFEAVYDRKRQPGQAPLEGFRQRVAALLRDDLGHAQHILDEAVLFHRQYSSLQLRGPVPGETSDPEDPRRDFRSLAYFRSVLDELYQCLDPKGSGLPPVSLDLLQKLSAFATKEPSETDLFLKPYHRFVVGAALRLAPSDQLPQCLRGEYDHKENTWVTGPSLLRALDDAANQLPRERDPLSLLRDCQITRFLTTNYDQEIDRRLRSEGLTHEHQSTPPDASSDPLARHRRTLVFDRKHVGEMLAFAARDGRRLVEVVHLHGRADYSHTLVVTNEDYQKHYLSVDDQQAGMDAALAAAFGGNAILFVGSGMGEDDLLRPLRQFIGDRAPGTRRVTIAIVPADKKGGDRAIELEKLRNLQRYGVYTIHTGDAGFKERSAKLAAESPDRPRTQEIPRRWLSRVAELKRRIDDVLNLKSSHPLDSRCEAVKSWLLDAFPNENRLIAPSSLEGVQIHPEFPGLDIEHEIDLLNEAVAIVRKCAGKEANVALAEVPVSAFRVALEGCMDSILGAFLCARLIRMKGEGTDYNKDWLQPPRPDDPVNVVRSILNSPGEKKTQRDWDSSKPLWVRHGVANAPSPRLLSADGLEPSSISPTSGSALFQRRFYTGAPSQTFDHLLKSLAAQAAPSGSLPPPRGRRLLVFIARRGVGKGHFFAALSNAARLEELRQCLGNPAPTHESESRRRWPAIFLNCGLSHEVTSIFDFLPELLLQAAQRLLDDWDVPAEAERWTQLRNLKAAADTLSHDRLGRLTHILRNLHSVVQSGQRIIVALSGLSILFDRDGSPKNAQVERLFEVLLDEPGARAPWDLILVSGERRFPQRFRSPAGLPLLRNGVAPKTQYLIELRHGPLSVKREAGLVLRRAKIALTDPESLSQSSADTPKNADGNKRAYVHFLAPTRATIMATAYFPSVILLLALDAGLRSLSRDEAKVMDVPLTHGQRLAQVPPNQFQRRISEDIRARVMKVLDSGAVGQMKRTRDPQEPKTTFKNILAAAAIWAARGKPWQHEVLKDHLNPPNVIIKAAPGCNDTQAAQILEQIVDRVDTRLRSLFLACGKSRFGLTVLLGTAYQYLAGLVTVDANPSKATPEQFATAVRQCIEFLNTTQQKLESIADPRRVEAIIDTATATFAGLDRDQSRSLNDCPNLRSCSELAHFQGAILWQLAVIGQPSNIAFSSIG